MAEMPENWNFIAEKGFPYRFQRIISQTSLCGSRDITDTAALINWYNNFIQTLGWPWGR
jgi:hypothetical protein